MSFHDMECLLKLLLMIGFMDRFMMSSLGVCFCSILRMSMVIKSNNCCYLSLVDVSTLNFTPISMVICTHLRASVLTVLHSLQCLSEVLLILFCRLCGIKYDG